MLAGVDWAEQVTAGNTVPSGQAKPRPANRARCGVCWPIIAGVRPTMSRTTSGRVIGGGSSDYPASTPVGAFSRKTSGGVNSNRSLPLKNSIGLS